LARITVEDCLKQAECDKFTLVRLATKRVIQLRKGTAPTVETSNKEIVLALREIAAGTIRQKTVVNPSMSNLENIQIEIEAPEESYEEDASQDNNLSEDA